MPPPGILEALRPSMGRPTRASERVTGTAAWSSPPPRSKPCPVSPGAKSVRKSVRKSARLSSAVTEPPGAVAYAQAASAAKTKLVRRRSKASSIGGVYDRRILRVPAPRRAEYATLPRMSRAVTLIYGHPYPARSRAGRVLLDGVRDLPGVEVRSLYDLYPDFDIDVQAEQAALLKAELIVWQCPFYWYGVPALLQSVVREGAGARLGVRRGGGRAPRQDGPLGPHHGRLAVRLFGDGHARPPVRGLRPRHLAGRSLLRHALGGAAAGGSRRAPADPRRAARGGPPVSNADREPGRRGAPWLSTDCSSR